MIVSAFRAREIAMNAKASDMSLEVAFEKIIKRAKCGFTDTEVSIDKEHIDDVSRRLSESGYSVHVSQGGVYYNTLRIDWS